MLVSVSLKCSLLVGALSSSLRLEVSRLPSMGIASTSAGGGAALAPSVAWGPEGRASVCSKERASVCSKGRASVCSERGVSMCFGAIATEYQHGETPVRLNCNCNAQEGRREAAMMKHAGRMEGDGRKSAGRKASASLLINCNARFEEANTRKTNKSMEDKRKPAGWPGGALSQDAAESVSHDGKHDRIRGGKCRRWKLTLNECVFDGSIRHASAALRRQLAKEVGR